MTAGLILVAVLMLPGGLDLEILSPAPEEVSGRVYPRVGGTVSLRVTRAGEPVGGAGLTATYLPGSKVKKFSVPRTRYVGLSPAGVASCTSSSPSDGSTWSM